MYYYLMLLTIKKNHLFLKYNLQFYVCKHTCHYVILIVSKLLSAWSIDSPLHLEIEFVPSYHSHYLTKRQFFDKSAFYY